jgi:hypothetical protein
MNFLQYFHQLQKLNKQSEAQKEQYYKKKLRELGVKEEEIEGKAKMLLEDPKKSINITEVPSDSSRLLKLADLMHKSGKLGFEDVLEHLLILKTEQDQVEEYDFVRSQLEFHYQSEVIYSQMIVAFACAANKEYLNVGLYEIINKFEGDRYDLAIMEDLYKYFSGEGVTFIGQIKDILEIDNIDALHEAISTYNKGIRLQTKENGDIPIFIWRLKEFLLKDKIDAITANEPKPRLARLTLPKVTTYSEANEQRYIENIEQIINKASSLEVVKRNEKLNNVIKDILSLFENNRENPAKELDNLVELVKRLENNLREDTFQHEEELKDLNKSLKKIKQEKEKFDYAKNSINSNPLKLEEVISTYDSISPSVENQDSGIPQFDIKDATRLEKTLLFDYLVTKKEEKLFRDIQLIKGANGNDKELDNIQQYLLNNKFFSDDHHTEHRKKLDTAKLDGLFSARDIINESKSRNKIKKLEKDKGEQLFLQGLEWIYKLDIDKYNEIKNNVSEGILRKFEQEQKKQDPAITVFAPVPYSRPLKKLSQNGNNGWSKDGKEFYHNNLSYNELLTKEAIADATNFLNDPNSKYKGEFLTYLLERIVKNIHKEGESENINLAFAINLLTTYSQSRELRDAGISFLKDLESKHEKTYGETLILERVKEELIKCIETKVKQVVGESGNKDKATKEFIKEIRTKLASESNVRSMIKKQLGLPVKDKTLLQKLLLNTLCDKTKSDELLGRISTTAEVAVAESSGQPSPSNDGGSRDDGRDSGAEEGSENSAGVESGEGQGEEGRETSAGVASGEGKGEEEHRGVTTGRESSSASPLPLEEEDEIQLEERKGGEKKQTSSPTSTTLTPSTSFSQRSAPTKPTKPTEPTQGLARGGR